MSYSHISTHDKLIKFFKGIDYEMDKTQSFLLGFFLCSKYINNNKSIEECNFLEIFNEFMCEYIIDQKQKLFEINQQIFKNDMFLNKNKNEDSFTLIKSEENEKLIPKDYFDMNFSGYNQIEIPLIPDDNDLHHDKKEEVLTCNICQNDYYTGDLENYNLDCGHYMHFECFNTYLQNQVIINIS